MDDRPVGGAPAAWDPEAIAVALLAASDDTRLVEPIAAGHPGFDLTAAYDVLDHVARHRRGRGWTTVGRKIGFTNTTIWPLYGVDAPLWAHIWDRTVHDAVDGRLTLPLDGLVQPRIEPEVVFRLSGPVPPTDDAAAALSSVAAVAAGFEVVQCLFPGWRFTLPDCTAAFGLHGALVVGPWVTVDDAMRSTLVDRLTSFEVRLRRDDVEVDRGVGSNVLGSPALALAHLAQVLPAPPHPEALGAGEVVTTGTVTDAWPVVSGETWTSDYGDLGVEGLRLTFA